MARPRKNADKAQNSLLTPDEVAEVPVEEQPYPLPEGWKWVRLGDALHLQAGKNISARDIHSEKTDEFPYPCFGGNGIRGYVSEYNREGNFPLIGRQGALCGNIKFASGKFYATEHAVAVSGKLPHEITWVSYCLRNMNLNQYATATAQPGLAVSTLNQLPFPYPPFGEQQRIVDRIESLFAKLDEAKAKAEAVLDGFEIRKAAILHKAFTGVVTAKWREEKGFSFDSWKKICLGKILKVSSGKGLTSKNMDNSGKIPVYGGNGITGYHNQSNVVKNTIVIGRVGYYCGSVHYIKKEAWVTDNALIVSFDRNKFESNFLFYLLLHTDLRQNDSSTAQPVISGSKIYPIEITITTNILEQQKIVRILDSLFAKEQQVKEAAETVLHQLKLMKKAILARAFRGELGTHGSARDTLQNNGSM